jgi:hypothetical protein
MATFRLYPKFYLRISDDEFPHGTEAISFGSFSLDGVYRFALFGFFKPVLQLAMFIIVSIAAHHVSMLPDQIFD